MSSRQWPLERRSLTWHLGAADRETLFSGLLAWLLDPRGSHALGDRVLRDVWPHLTDGELPGHGVDVRAEERTDSRRFDISVIDAHDLDQALLIVELKCKTQGSASQLLDYEKPKPGKRAPRVARCGLAEWNWPNLSTEQRQRWRLLDFCELADRLDGVAHDVADWGGFLTDLARHLREESDFFSCLHTFVFQDGAAPTWLRPHAPALRFIHQLYWEWIHERLERDSALDEKDIESRSEQSGVWLALPWDQARVGLGEGIPGLRVELPAGHIWWLHIELEDHDRIAGLAGLLAPAGHSAGKCELRIQRRKGTDTNDWEGVRKALMQAEEQWKSMGFQLRTKSPGIHDGYFYALRAPLTVAHFRYREIRRIIEAFVGPLKDLRHVSDT